MEKRKLKIGDTVFLERLGSYYKNNEIRELEVAVVTKAGRKYFEVDKGYGRRFFVETGKQETSWTAQYRIWFSIEEWKKLKEDQEITQYVQNYFRDSFHKISIENLYKIKEIICAPSERSKILCGI